MQKKGKMAVSALVFTGMGIGAWMMYKKKNPNAMEDMKKAIRNVASNIANSLDDMDME